MLRKFPRVCWCVVAGVFVSASAARLTAPQGLHAASDREAVRPAREFQVDVKASRIYVKVGATSRFGNGHGIEGRLNSGKLALGGRGELIIDMRSSLTDTPEARRYVGLSGTVSTSDRREGTANMLGARVLDVERHPRAVYTIKSARPRDGQALGAPGFYQLNGQFMLHGVVRPLPLLALAEQTDTPGVLRLRGSVSILQSDFGITPFSALGGRVKVADRIDIWGDLLLRPAP